GAVLAFVGSVLGAGAGVWYTGVLLHALGTVWHGATHTKALETHVEPSTVLLGGAVSLLAALMAMGIAVRRRTRISAHALLAGETGAESPFRCRRLDRWVAVASGAAAVVVLTFLGGGTGQQAAGAFFAAGALLLLAGLALCRALLRVLGSTYGTRLTLTGLGLRNTARRSSRSMSTIVMVALGSFLVLAVSANRKDPFADAHRRSSGTGGFALLGELTSPLVRDLNMTSGRKSYGLDTSTLDGTAFVPLRVHEGDDASCLNMNRPQQPRLLGVRAAELRSRRAFTFGSVVPGALADDGWALLTGHCGHTVPAVGDEATVRWALGKGVGDTIGFTDERGRPFLVRIVGILANSVLQGGLLIPEEAFLERFPSESGYRMVLVDAPPERVEAVAQILRQSLSQNGLELTPTTERLATFLEIENTYLAIFQVLGGLGLTIGCVGVGVILARNVIERRGELALLRAVGFRQSTLRWLVIWEHGVPTALGLGCGIGAALAAVLPALLSPGAGVPYLSIALTLGAVAGSACLWTFLAAFVAVKDPMLRALRDE
ncbi:FtsX-like permease family protein, partial [Planctomycetota bacterium]